MVFTGLFWSYIKIFGVILVIFWVRCYFGHICVSGSLLCFRSFWSFQGYFCHFRSFVFMLVIMVFLG
jgi:hypothetical protein